MPDKGCTDCPRQNLPPFLCYNRGRAILPFLEHPLTHKRFLAPAVLARLQTVYNELHPMPPGAGGTSLFAASLKGFLERFGETMELTPGEILFAQGEEGENLYWVETGVLAILHGKLRSPHLLTFRRAGHVVGEIALLENVPRTASVAAITSARLKYLNKDRFHEMLANVPEVGIDDRLLTERVRESSRWITAGHVRPPDRRYSRQALDLRLQERIERAQRYDYRFALVFIDLDRFKQINDTYGHARGDDVLVAFVRRIVADLRTTDVLFRYGGDEFILLLPGIRLDTCAGAGAASVRPGEHDAHHHRPAPVPLVQFRHCLLPGRRRNARSAAGNSRPPPVSPQGDGRAIACLVLKHEPASFVPRGSDCPASCGLGRSRPHSHPVHARTGKLRALAKGARKLLSRKAGHLRPVYAHHRSTGARARPANCGAGRNAGCLCPPARRPGESGVCRLRAGTD